MNPTHSRNDAWDDLNLVDGVGVRYPINQPPDVGLKMWAEIASPEEGSAWKVHTERTVETFKKIPNVAGGDILRMKKMNNTKEGSPMP